MYILLKFLAVTSVCGVMAVEPDISALENDFTPETYASFNMSHKSKKFDLKEIEALGRRWSFTWYNWNAAKHVHTWELNRRACFLIAMTYLSAIPEIRKYFQNRYLYANNKEYEIGYVTYEIVQKYQMMVEIYQIMYNKYYLEQTRWKVPTSYIFYMYRHVLELGMSITHLCHMLHEVEGKYKDAQPGVWDDYDQKAMSGYSTKRRPKPDAIKKYEDARNDYLKRREQEAKARNRKRKKDRLGMDLDTRVTTPSRQAHKSFWPLHYGWSIEFW